MALDAPRLSKDDRRPSYDANEKSDTSGTASTDTATSESVSSTTVEGTETFRFTPDEKKVNFDGVGFATGLLWPQRRWIGIDTKVGPFLRRGSFAAFGAWLLGLVLVYTYCPTESFEYLEGAELYANVAVLVVLISTNTSRVIYLAIRDKSFVFVNTGIMFGSITVQVIAISSILLMIAIPTPVLIDPVTGLRTHMIRWVEWTSLAFLMTFLTESIDMPLKDNKGPTMSWIHGLAIGMSTAVGGLFPFCSSWWSWLTIFGISWILFTSLFHRLYHRYHRLALLPADGSFDDKVEYDRAKYSFKTIAVCTIVWTFLAGSYSIIAISRKFIPEDSFLAGDSVILVSESIFEIISKVWYLNLLVEVHNIVFDDATRTMRRLEELRVIMSTIWNTSSDVMIWCSIEKNQIHAVVSPSFFDIVCPPDDMEKLQRLRPDSKKPTLILEIDQIKGNFVHHILHLKLGSTITREDAMELMMNDSKTKEDKMTMKSMSNISTLAGLLNKVFRSKESELVLMENGFEGLNHQQVCCEAKVSKVDKTGLVVLRDISERFEFFETEKKLVEEITARKKDAEANRFTRHEVKNSILACIGVLESMKTPVKDGRPTTYPVIIENGEEYDELKNINHADNKTKSEGYSDSISNTPSVALDYLAFEEHAGELDNTLRSVLETITDHAMSREVIYEEYEVRKERVCVPEILSNIRKHANSSMGSRFTIETFPKQFPTLGMDPRLLRYIYQNALSNACRYGKRGAPIDTILFFNNEVNEFRMEVVNSPGIGHEKLIQLSHKEIQELVFSPRTSLQNTIGENQDIHEHNSSGDGAWIMQKCASILGGSCDLRFEPDRTVFSFWCNANEHKVREIRDPELLALPDKTWGIVIDDSTIQRKLMDRFLKIAGIAKDRRVVVGATSDEIYSFNDLVINLVKKHTDSKILVIADENLDVLEGNVMHGSVSGSLCLQKILARLSPEESSRVLALVRSANDSAQDTDLYKSRCHGYLVKAPIDKNGVLKSIQPWWFQRFPVEVNGGTKNYRTISQGIGDIDDGYDPFTDIKAALEVLNALSLASPASLQRRWRSIQDRLQALKGDLKCMVPRGGPQLISISDTIDSIRGADDSSAFSMEWQNLREKIESLLTSYQ